SYPRQNGLAVALRELGRIERTLFILDWLQSVELRRRVHAGLNMYVPQGVQAYPTLRPLIGGTLNIKHVRAHWDDILRLASSIKQG
ncbi:Tn3 family transposase, partial [Klebsiella pneumoniae]|uniref:Tn3 family transposase n=1 Tax=Klebsiella pneumoniae TaxID=573 RepID=UPI0013B38A44